MTKQDKINLIDRRIEKYQERVDNLQKVINNLKALKEDTDSFLCGMGNNWCDIDEDNDGMVIVAVGDVIGTKYGEYGEVIKINHDNDEVTFINQHGEVDLIHIGRIN